MNAIICYYIIKPYRSTGTQTKTGANQCVDTSKYAVLKTCYIYRGRGFSIENSVYRYTLRGEFHSLM